MYGVNLIKVELNVDVSSTECDVFFNLRVGSETIKDVDYTIYSLLCMCAYACVHVCEKRPTSSLRPPN